MLGLTPDQSFVFGMLALRTLSSAANSLPAPGKKFDLYEFFYTFVQQEASNMSLLFAARFPTTQPRSEEEHTGE